MSKAMTLALISVFAFVAALLTVNSGSEWARLAVPLSFLAGLASLWMKDRGFNSDTVASLMLVGSFGLMYYHALFAA